MDPCPDPIADSLETLDPDSGAVSASRFLESGSTTLGKKYSLALHLIETDTDPPKLCRSDRIRIQNTDKIIHTYLPPEQQTI
jgi:hypothetical protein